VEFPSAELLARISCASKSDRLNPVLLSSKLSRQSGIALRPPGADLSFSISAAGMRK
jgi:hypothetical protein